MPLSTYFSILGAMVTVHRSWHLENRLGNWALIDDSFDPVKIHKAFSVLKIVTDAQCNCYKAQQNFIPDRHCTVLITPL